MVRTMKLQNLKLALRADSGLALGTIYPLNAMRNILGRSVDVAVPVDDTKVSRIHAAIDQQNGFLYLVDLGSTNGSFLNDRRIQNASLISVGDRVRVGSASFVVELLENAKTQVSANWKEPTRAILRGEALPSSPPLIQAVHETVVQSEAAVLPTAEGHESSAPLLMERSLKPNFFLTSQGRWISILAAIALVGAALATTLSHPA
jgi:predicted component of type VI protein secretion system